VLIVVAVLVLAGGAGAAARWLMAKHADKTTNTVAKTVDPRPSSVKQADSLLVSGKTEEAAAYVKQQLDKPSLSNTERYELYVEQGLIAQNAEDYQLAADAFGKAFAIKEDYDLAQKLGSTYQQLGDKQKAIDYYKKAIALNPPSNPMRESNNNIFQQMIDQLQAELKQ
jgi:tetratricopeptide (TPR) repeat protein